LFDIIIGNPPYNKNGIKSCTSKDKSQTIWPDFIKLSFDLLKPNGYLCFITPLTWILERNKLHKLMFEKNILWLELWSNLYSKQHFKVEIPISLFVLQNKLREVDALTKFNSCVYYDRKVLKVISEEINLNDFDSLPLGGFNILKKLRKFIIENNCQLQVNTNVIKTYGDEFLLPENYTLEDKLNVTTYTIKEGLKVKRSNELHKDANKRKLIIANKRRIIGIFIDEGQLGLATNDKYYILGENLQLIKKILSFKFIKIVDSMTKYRMEFVNKEAFSYIPDLRKLNINDISEEDFYKLIGITIIDSF